MKDCCPTTHTHIYIFQASFIKCDGILFIIFNCKFSSLGVIFLCQAPGGKGVVLYLLPKHFRPYFWLSSGVV